MRDLVSRRHSVRVGVYFQCIYFLFMPILIMSVERCIHLIPERDWDTGVG